MITYRLRGLINLHVFATTGLTGALFLIFAAVSRYIPWASLGPEVNLVPCVLVILVAMLFSSRFITPISGRFHSLGWPDAAGLAIRQAAMVALVLFTLIVATKDRSISRVFLAHYLVLTWLLLIFINRLLPRFLAKVAFGDRYRLPTVFLGGRRTLQRLDAWIAQKLHLGVTPVGFLSDDFADGEQLKVGRFLGRTNELRSFIETGQVAQVILLDVPMEKEETSRIIETCQATGCRLLIFDDVGARLPIPMVSVAEEGYYFFTVQQEPLEDPFNRAVKRTFDVMVSLPVIVFLLPPLCLWVWIMQSLQAPGPLFFVRPRGGRRRSEFRMLKFRSMHHERPDPMREATQARLDDDRIFSFGRFLRRKSLDEIPQFWNVLKGEMSVVGPRPHLPRHDREFSQIAKAYRTRHLVKPGITGLAQIRGYRGEISEPARLQERLAQDLFYITHWSVWLDLQITLKTFWQIFFPPQTAY